MFTQKFSMFLLLTFVISLVSCATYQPPKNYQFDKTKTINKPFEEVWGKIIQWFAKNNYPIITTDKNTGLINAEYKVNLEKVNKCIDCGVESYNSIIKKDGYSGNINVIIEIKKDNSVDVTINTFFKGKLQYISVNKNQETKTTDKDITCNSTGYLENEIFEYISK